MYELYNEHWRTFIYLLFISSGYVRKAWLRLDDPPKGSQGYGTVILIPRLLLILCDHTSRPVRCGRSRKYWQVQRTMAQHVVDIPNWRSSNKQFWSRYVRES